MKNLILSAFIAFTICLGGAYAQTATIAPAPLKPQWTCRFTNPITFSDGPTTSWSQAGWPYLVDAAGNAAVYVSNGKSNVDVLWISSKGTLLAAIPTPFYGGESILSVSANALSLMTSNDSWVRYSFAKGKLVQTLPPNGDYSSTVYTLPSYGMIGITETDGVGNPTAISFFRY